MRAVAGLAMAVAICAAAIVVSGMTERGQTVIVSSLAGLMIGIPVGAALLYWFAYRKWLARRTENR